MASIAGVGKTLIRLLQDRFHALHNGLEGLTFDLFTTTNFEQAPSNKVSLFLYRIEVDPTQRHREIAPLAPGDPPKTALALNLRYLLTIWADDAEREHQVMQDCIDIFEREAIISGARLASGYTWEPDTALKVTLDTLSHEDMMRLWDLLEPKYRLSVSYLVRAVRLTPIEQPAAPPVLSRTNILKQGAS